MPAVEYTAATFQRYQAFHEPVDPRRIQSAQSASGSDRDTAHES